MLFWGGGLRQESGEAAAFLCMSLTREIRGHNPIDSKIED
jgi:hypothetical protein